MQKRYINPTKYEIQEEMNNTINIKDDESKDNINKIIKET